MSTDPTVMFLGFNMLKSNFLHLAGLFGGFLPYVVDLIQRQSQLPQERAVLDRGYYFLKLLVLPASALLVTGFAVTSSNVTTWLAALYLGGSFPVLAQKAITIKQPIETTDSGA